MAWVRGWTLGAGSYGRVYTAISQETGRRFAVEEISVAHGHLHRAKLEDELRVCQSLQHPNIAACLGHGWGDSELYVYREYLVGGSVATVLGEFGGFEHKALRGAAKCLFKGLAYLHTRSPPVVHRNVKAANLLVGDSLHNVKLADYGVRRWGRDERAAPSTPGPWPARWAAPEVARWQGGHSCCGDVWSAGCTVIEMASAEPPWGEGAFESITQALEHIGLSDATPPVPADVTPACRGLIDLCTQRCAEDRPSACAVLKHRFFEPC